MTGTKTIDYARASVDDLRFSSMTGEELLSEANRLLNQAWKLLIASSDKEHSEPFVEHKIVTIANLVSRAIDESASVAGKIEVMKGQPK